jgi:hypothetical protein
MDPRAAASVDESVDIPAGLILLGYHAPRLVRGSDRSIYPNNSDSEPYIIYKWGKVEQALKAFSSYTPLGPYPPLLIFGVNSSGITEIMDRFTELITARPTTLPTSLALLRPETLLPGDIIYIPWIKCIGQGQVLSAAVLFSHNDPKLESVYSLAARSGYKHLIFCLPSLLCDSADNPTELSMDTAVCAIRTSLTQPHIASQFEAVVLLADTYTNMRRVVNVHK